MRVPRLAPAVLAATVVAGLVGAAGPAHAAEPVNLQVAITGPGSAFRTASAAVSGEVIDPATSTGVAGVPVEVRFVPYTGSVQVVHVVSRAGGAYDATSPAGLTSTTVVTATVGQSSASVRVLVRIEMICNVPLRVALGKRLVISCSTQDLAYHSVLALRITGGSVRHEVLFAKTDSSGTVTFPVTFSHPDQRLNVRATTATTRTYGASSSATYPLHVR